MPNKRAKIRKRTRAAANKKNKVEGRTALQHAKFLRKLKKN